MSVSKIYAKALHGTILMKNGSGAPIAKVQTEIGELLGLIEGSKELRVALMSPVISSKQKMELIKKICDKAKFSDIVTQFLMLLARRGRFSDLKGIHTALDEVRLEVEGGLLGQLVSADPVEAGDVKQMADSFTKKLGKKVEFKTAIDPDLLAGLKITVGGVTYDGSLRAQLQRIKDRFEMIGR